MNHKITLNGSQVLTNKLITCTAALTLILITACSGGGAEVEDNPIPAPPPSSNYSGPDPSTDDVQSFKLNVWDNLSPQNRCGQCHGIGQSPEFVNLNDVNTAYASANTIVNLNSPKDSLIVTKVAAGHNCWLTSDSACADTITSYISAWAGESSGNSNSITLEEPPIREPGSSKTFPSDSALFSTTIHPLLTQYCANCHTDSSATPVSPFFASSDADVAYEAAKAKINLDTPANSRFVLRLRNEFHNCWDNDCAAASTEMENAIQLFSDQIDLTEVDPSLLKSKALFLTDGTVASGGGRFDTNAIAIWNFKTGSGFTAFDTSGVEPAINLTLSGTFNWVGGWGVQIIDGKGQGSTDSSKKLHDLIKSTGEYSVEAWVVPANVTQEEAGIVSYSAGTDARNFTLSQTLYNYNYLNRSSETDQNGQAQIATADAAEVLQTTLQHVVATFSPTTGRKIYVNGELVAEEPEEISSNLNDWNDTYAFVLGNEVSGNRLFAGTYRMVAIHNRTLTPEQVVQNFDVGVGEKFFMLFSISHLVNLPESYIMYEVSQFDSYSYLFTEPTFINLNDQATPNSIDIEKIRIAINGKEAITGQAFQNVIANANAADYNNQTGQLLSRLGTVIALEKGPGSDEFFLTFEKINGQENAFVEAPTPDAATPVDLESRPEIGIRDFAEINATLSQITGVSMANADVMSTYNAVKQQLPTLTDIDIFVSSQQMGITQLAIEYCNALVEDSTLRASYFSGFDFNASANNAFDSTAKKDIIFDALINNTSGLNLASQPDNADFKAELDSLTVKLTACGSSCEADRTKTVVKAVCAAATANATMLIQ